MRGGTKQVIGAVFTEEGLDGNALPHADVATLLAEEAGRAGVELTDCMLVTGSRWWSYSCQNTDCCPAEGNVMPETPTVFQTAAVYAGIAVASSREALAAQLAPLPGREGLTGLIEQAQGVGIAALAGERLAAHQASGKRALFAAARAAATGAYPTDAAGRALRGGVEQHADPRRGVDGDRRRPAGRRRAVAEPGPSTAQPLRRTGAFPLWLARLARRLPSPYDAPALFLYGWHAWRAGNGAVAGIAAERALASDPGYSAADLLLAALSRGVDPRQLPKLRPAKGGTTPTTA